MKQYLIDMLHTNLSKSFLNIKSSILLLSYARVLCQQRVTVDVVKCGI